MVKLVGSANVSHRTVRSNSFLVLLQDQDTVGRYILLWKLCSHMYDLHIKSVSVIVWNVYQYY